MNSRDALLRARDTLKKAGSETPYLDAIILLSFACSITREQLYARLGDELSDKHAETFEKHVLRRASGVPVAYIVGYQEFYGRRFRVDQRVLVPRPDSEILVETALKVIADTSKATVHDCCTGSGSIAVSIAAERPDARVSMSDIEPGALRVANENSEQILGHSIPSVESDLLSKVSGKYNLITCNPPYLTTEQMRQIGSVGVEASGDAAEKRKSVAPAAEGVPGSTLSPASASPQQVPAHEPCIALDGGVDGLTVVRKLSTNGLAHLRPNGYIVVEVADFQADTVQSLLESDGYTNVFIVRDLGGNRRVVGGQAWSK